jgi:hypothetical protein
MPAIIYGYAASVTIRSGQIALAAFNSPRKAQARPDRDPDIAQAPWSVAPLI